MLISFVICYFSLGKISFYKLLFNSRKNKVYVCMYVCSAILHEFHAIWIKEGAGRRKV